MLAEPQLGAFLEYLDLEYVLRKLCIAFVALSCFFYLFFFFFVVDKVLHCLFHRPRLRLHLAEHFSLSENCSRGKVGHYYLASVIIQILIPLLLHRVNTRRNDTLCGVRLYLSRGSSRERSSNTRTRQKDNNISHFESQFG